MLIKAENGACPKFCKSFRRERETAWKRSSEACLRRKREAEVTETEEAKQYRNRKGGQ